MNVRALKRHRVDINAPSIRPIVVNYLRAAVTTLGAHGRPLVDELAIAVSHLNAAAAIAVMNADAAGKAVDTVIFSEALMEVADVSRARNVLLDWTLTRFSGGTEAVHFLAGSSAVPSAPSAA